MTEKTKSIAGWIIFFAVIGFFVWFNSGGAPEENNQKNDYQPDTKKQTQKTINRFVKEYDAQSKVGNIAYTFQLQRKIVSSTKPFIFTADLSDVYLSNQEYYLKLSPAVASWSQFIESGTSEYYVENTYFTLNGCKDRIDHILNNSDTSGFGKYVVVAELNDVTVPKIKIKGGEDESNVEIGDTNARLVSGDCLDLKYVEDLNPSATTTEAIN